MNAPAPVAGWYPDPQNPTQQRYWDGTAWAADTPRVSVAAVFGRTFAYLLGIAVIIGIISGTVGMPIYGTMFGLIVGIGIGIPLALITAAVFAAAARPTVTPKTYRRCIDVTFVVLFVATVALAVVWINQRALAGPWAAYTMIALVAVCFIAVRPRLRRLVPEQA
jgi:hypothetical protein